MRANLIWPAAVNLTLHAWQQAESVRESARLAFQDAERAAEAEISRLEKALGFSLSQARDSEAGLRKKRTKALAELQV